MKGKNRSLVLLNLHNSIYDLAKLKRRFTISCKIMNDFLLAKVYFIQIKNFIMGNLKKKQD